MINSVFIKYYNKEINTKATSDGVTIYIGERDTTVNQSINFTYDEFFEIVEDVQRQLDESTIEELEDQIIMQQSQIEELKEQIEIQEQFIELRKEQINEHEVF